ncbi:hypothetical protein OESDEN_19725 [Oesophagostomum dentatum]|uniref:Uncharacterized protein n=1 Tax=Oesophagostomum dentatum TaxID=61180 RepID=A0A0B1S5H5_OESDE|nr:hypothetical protein OESDEN_19725 [Oesophagostomum dentatum]
MIWMMDLLAIAIKVIPLLLHLFMMLIFLRDRKRYFSIVTSMFHFLAVLSFLLYLVVFVKMHTSTSIIVLHTMLSSHFMKAEKINLLQGFIILIAYTSSIVIDFMDGSIVDWNEYPAYLVREIAEGVTGVAIPVMIFVCSHHFRTDAAELFVFWRR